MTCLRSAVLLGMAIIGTVMVTTAQGEDFQEFQYRFEGIDIPPATADEPKLERLSVAKAAEYLEKGTLAWNGTRKCVTCHTSGTYFTVRPALSSKLGVPGDKMREHVVDQFAQFEKKNPEEQQQSTYPAQAIYIAAGLAEWDAHITHKLSPETERALAQMFKLQRDTGTWGSLDCWPPYESSAYHLATVAAMAAGTAPGWLANLKDPQLLSAVESLKKYLRTETPKQDYDRTLLLWASARLPDLLTADKKQELVDLVLSKQQADGGWSIRTFGQPEQWGSGNRAEKLRSEPEFANPPSDGHQTGLAIVVLRESGVAANDLRIQKGLHWLRTNQRASGRWWTRSLNTDKWHYITYSGTALPLLALQLCDALPATDVKTAAN